MNMPAALSDPHSILLSENTARKYFGTKNPMGRTIRMQDKYDLQITGIFKDLPNNSHFAMDIMIPFDIMRAFFKQDLSTWNNNSYYTYFLLRENAEPAQVEAMLPALLAKYAKKERRLANSYYLQPLTKIHLHSHINIEINPNNDIKYIYLFATIGLLLLLIACINYVNLATAGAARRAKEIGIRKVLGASSAHITTLISREYIVKVLLAVLISWPLFFNILNMLHRKPVYSDLASKYTT
jgi:putative ABC transport system permease protein